MVKGVGNGRQWIGRLENISLSNSAVILYVFLVVENSVNSEVIILNIYGNVKVIPISKIVSLHNCYYVVSYSAQCNSNLIVPT